LLGSDTEAVCQQRIDTAKTLAKQLNCHAVLKGAGSICTTPSGPWYINTSGNPGLASAGTGDVLSGMIGAFLAQGLSAQDALLLSVNLHGAAADTLVAQGIGPIGLTASEVIDAARRLLNKSV
jgi:NAD(P)H-hydrate repair Nnr-like enzyme with NAD(P)H-hydrate dehydratase domain